MSEMNRNMPNSPHSASALFTVLFFIIICVIFLYSYLLRPPPKPDTPPNILMYSSSGPVLFYHRYHYHDDGGAFECIDCHHNYDPEEESSHDMNCRNCHYNDSDIVENVCPDDATHPRCIGKKCNECHDGESCDFCHRKQP